MTAPRDLTPFLYGLTPDPAAVTDARAFAFMLPSAEHVAGRLEDLLMTFTHVIHLHREDVLPGAAREALQVFTFAASGLYALLQDAQQHPHGDAWATLTRARLWAVTRAQEARTEHGDARGTVTAWQTVTRLLDTAPTLTDGEAEDMTAATLEALTRPAPPADPSLYVPQHVEVLAGVSVRLYMGGGEDYTVTRADVALPLPLPRPDGSLLLSLTLGGEGLTVYLDPEQAATVRRAWGFGQA